MTDYKIILYGDFAVGKTSLTDKFVRNTFSNPSSTIGASFTGWSSKVTKKNGKEEKIRFGLWDTAGQERFRSLLPMYLRGADAIFYCWDYTIEFDIEKATFMYSEAVKLSPDCHFYLVFTKIDKTTDYPVFSDIGEEWAETNGLKGIHYTSSLSGVGVQELFEVTAKNLLETQRRRQIKTTVEPNRIYNFKKYWCNIL
jgi:Ras-related protein Rab-5C